MKALTTVSKNALNKGVWAMALLGLSSLTQVAAGESVDERMSVEPNSFISIEHMNGKAEIIGWDQDEIHVTGELGERTEEFIFRRSGNEVRIEVEVEPQKGFKWPYSSSDEGDDLTIYVPRQSEIRYESINANVSVREIAGDVSAEVVNGQIRVDDISGRVRLESVNGDIKLQGLRGDLAAETVNGDIYGEHDSKKEAIFETVNGDINIRTSSPDVRVESVNGDIELNMQNVDELDITTVNGRVEANMNLNRSADVRATSVGGSIVMTFGEDVSARFDIEAHAGGRITNDITSDKMQKAKYGPRRWLEFSHNGGHAHVEISTVSGRIGLETK